MERPDEVLFEHDVASAEFRSGVAKGLWAIADADILPKDLAWPMRVLWIAAAPRANAPNKFYLLLNLAGYRSVSPTGSLWDASTKSTLEAAKRPKGKPSSRFAKVFRTDWNNDALYHPYDRVASQSHADWAREQPHLVWTCDHTIVDYLEEFHSLLNSGDYFGV